MRFVSVVPDNLSVPALNPANDIISARVSLRIGASSYTPLQRVGHAIRLRTQSPYPTPFSSQLNSEFHEQQHHEIAPNITFYISLVCIPTSHTMCVRPSTKHI